MPTFLTTRKMSPALAARVRASVRGRRPTPGRSMAPRAVSVLRFGALALIVGLATWLVLLERETERQLEAERAALLERARREGSQLTRKELFMVERVRTWVARRATGAPEEQIADELRDEATFGETLKRPLVYVRGPIASFQGPITLGETAAASFKDAFVSCLLDPPSERTDKALLSRARKALSGQTSTVDNVERLADALAGLPLLSDAWRARVQAADSQRELGTLRRQFETAPLAAAKRAARADLLLFVMDEPNDGSGPTELDGASPHHVRVELIDLDTEQVLLRLRRHVDPTWIAPALRVEYASGMGACKLALDVREEVATAAANEGG